MMNGVRSYKADALQDIWVDSLPSSPFYSKVTLHYLEQVLSSLLLYM